MIAEAPNRSAPSGVSVTQHWREREETIAFHGVKCRACGQEQFPMVRVCHTCQTRDEMDPLRLADKPASVFTYTKDFLGGLPDPPEVMVVLELEGGARVYCQMTDRDPDQVGLGMPVEWTFRKIHDYGDLHNYFWKCRPLTV